MASCIVMLSIVVEKICCYSELTDIPGKSYN